MKGSAEVEHKSIQQPSNKEIPRQQLEPVAEVSGNNVVIHGLKDWTMKCRQSLVLELRQKTESLSEGL